MSKQKSTKLSILFLSCDKYQDVWKPLFFCVQKYFKQSMYPMYLGSNTVSYNNTIIHTLLSGKDKDWSTSLLTLLNHISTPYVFLWLEDIFPIGMVDVSRFDEAIGYMDRLTAKHIHMMPLPKPDYTTEKGRLGVYTKGAPYRVNALGFWNVEYLKKILISGENSWNFEIMGSYRSRYEDGFYCFMEPIFPRLHVIEKGKIFHTAFQYCTSHDIPLSHDTRKVIENTNTIMSVVQGVYFNFMLHIPWKFRLSVMNLLRKLLVSY